MERIQQRTSSFSSVLFSLALALLLTSCGIGDGLDITGSGLSSTTISGKVTLSSTVTAKPAMLKSLYSAPIGKPGSKEYRASLKPSTALQSALLAPVLNAVAFSGGSVSLYSADHPEWLYPVAESPAASDGTYNLSALKNASLNNSAYADGDPIPAGDYTVLAFKAGGWDPALMLTTDDLVAVQVVVNKYEGPVSIPDLVAQESTTLPSVTTMFGIKQNTNGTQTWGGSTTTMPANAAIQVGFSTAMTRASLTNGISISPAVSGKWSLSADWTTAMFYPNAGTLLTVGATYTVTVKGTDTDSVNAVTNVYGNSLAKTATGTFKVVAADIVAPTAEWESPTTIDMTKRVDVTTPIRIRANKPLDVNGLKLDGKIAGVSSMGAKPGVLFVGQNAGGYYVYEFVLGVPLKLGSTYDLSVTGGKGLNGIKMSKLFGSLETVSLADVASGIVNGLGGTTDVATLNSQAAVKDVFGKWIRSFSDRNLTQLQSVMSGDFYFEDAKIDPASDLNHDGRYSLAEFTDMLATKAFPQWEFCETTITGEIIGTPPIINVVADSDADFSFKMVAKTANTSQICLNSVPADTFYATLKKVNGAWTVVRASSGIDTRTKSISFPTLLDGLTLTQNGTPIPNYGSILLPDPTIPTTSIAASWNAATGVSSYVFIAVDGRNPEHGMACALPTSVTSFTGDCVTNGGVDVSGKFGFNNMAGGGTAGGGGFLVQGGSYHWEVIGLATITKTTISGPSKTALVIMKDISAISELQSFTVAGTYKEITVQVYGGVTASGVPATYSMLYDGYDLGSANQATITVTTANTTAATGSLYVDGSVSRNYNLTFSGGVATVTIDLSKGFNRISANDWNGLYKNFNLNTTGGTSPVIDISTIKDDLGNILNGDLWGHYKAPGASKVTILGFVTNNTAVANNLFVNSVSVNSWNQETSSYSYVDAPVAWAGTTGIFTATLDIYKGDNWISAWASYYDGPNALSYSYSDRAGVYTDTGTVWVPNISITSMTNWGTTTSSTQTASYGNSSDWEAILDPNKMVTVKGKFKNALTNGNYYVSSNGAYNNGTLYVLADGSFSLDVTLYTGWNYVSIYDGNWNWYGVNIYTANGKVIIKPKIDLVGGIAPTLPPYGGSGSVNTSACSVTVTGTAEPGSLNIYWNGYDGTASTYFYESQYLKLTGMPDTAIPFSFTVPLVGGIGSYNNIDVYDQDWKWTGVQVTTSGSCLAYTPPSLPPATVQDIASATVVPDVNLIYNTGVGGNITLKGTSNRAGRTITASTWACTSNSYSATTPGSSDGTDPVSGLPTYSWSIPMPVYNGTTYVSLSDGYNWQSLNISSTNPTPAPPALSATVTPGAITTPGVCGNNQWDAGAATIVNISGTTSAPAGKGNYTDPLGGNKQFTIAANGSYSFNVTVYNGTNYIYMYDTAWNNQTVAITTTNGFAKPQFVSITAPANTGTVTGMQTVTGTVTDPTTSGYKPAVVWASVYNAATLTYTSYTSDVYYQTTYGYSAIIYDATTGAYSFALDAPGFGLGDNIRIDIYAYDNVTYLNHGMSLEYNNPLGNSSYYYKPGSNNAGAGQSQAVQAEMMKQRLRVINRGR